MKPIYVMVGVFLALFLAALNQTMVSTAMPSIAASLGGMELYSWIFVSYMLASTVLVPIYGKLSDQFGRRPIFVFGIVTFIASAFIAGFAETMPQLILVRALQGVGAGAIIPIAFAIVGDLYPPAERARVQGWIGAAFGVASLIGPLAGGWISEHMHWRWTFWANVPVGLIALAVVLATLPRPVRRTGPLNIDYAGAALLVGALTPLLLLASLGGKAWPWASWQSAAMGLGGLALGAAFIWVEQRAKEPILPLALFKNPIFCVVVVASVLTGVVMFGDTMFLPLFVQGVLGQSATSAGMALMPFMLGMVTASALSGNVAAMTGRYKWLAVGGLGLLSVGAGALALLGVGSPTWYVYASAGLIGIGLGVTMPLFLLAVQNAVPVTHLGSVTALVQFFRSIGGTLGVAGLGALLTARTAAELPAGMPDIQALMSPAGVAALPAASLEAMRLALGHGLTSVFVAGAAMAVLTVIVALFLEERPLAKRAGPSLQEAGQELAAEGLLAPGVLRPEDEPVLGERQPG